jgi:hypothetical protein
MDTTTLAMIAVVVVLGALYAMRRRSRLKRHD